MKFEYEVLGKDQAASRLTFAEGENANKPTVYLIIVRAICRWLRAGILLLHANLDANDRIHIQAGQLSCFDNGYAYLWFNAMSLGYFDER